MGQFSFYTQDTNERIIVDGKQKIIMTDNQGNQYVETDYQGYGEFGGKDYYELLAEMNGLGSDREAGIDLAFSNSDEGRNPDCIHPSLTRSGKYMDGLAPRIDPRQGCK